jgi:hypothetical protein
MSNERGFYWIGILGLFAMALVWGPAPAVAIAASVALYLACDRAVGPTP